MQGWDGPIKGLFSKGNAYYIPPYQRGYAWRPERWQGVIQDVMEVATRTAEAPAHWLGVILVSDADIPNNPLDEDEATPYTVIDGQQRLVTLRVWMAALADYAAEADPHTKVSARALSSIIVQRADRKSFEVATTDGWRVPANHPLLDQGALEAYCYFRWILWLGDSALLSSEPILPPRIPDKTPSKSNGSWEGYWAAETAKGRWQKRLADAGVSRSPLKVTPEHLMDATKKGLRIFLMTHEAGKDEEQAIIFDTLNGMRTELEPLDHVRNSLFVRLPHSDAMDLYDNHWEPAETKLRSLRLKRMSPASSFLYDYLIARGERRHQGSINAKRTAPQFAALTKRDAAAKQDLAKFIRDDVVLAMASWPTVAAQARTFKHDGIVTRVSDEAWYLLRSIRALTENPANPLTLFYLTEFKRRASGIDTDVDLGQRLATVEAFLARHLLAGRAFSPLRTFFMEVMANVYPDPSQAALEAALAKHWPSDRDIKQFMRTAAFYSHASPNQVGAIMRGVERAISGAACVPIWIGGGAGEYTIEHIYPQKPSAQWGADLSSWGARESAMSQRLHHIGNLTVATKSFNSASGNKALSDKQADYGKLKNAPVGIHLGWLQAAVWTDAEIDARGEALVNKAIVQWPVP